MVSPTLIWFTRDLRLADHPALDAAARMGAPVVALFVLDDVSAGCWGYGSASRWFLAGALEALASAAAARGGRLVLRRGRADEIVAEVASRVRARAVFWSCLYDPWGRQIEQRLRKRLGDFGIAAQSLPGTLLFEPTQIVQADGEPYRVFTPFSRAWLAQEPPQAPLPVPSELVFCDPGLESETIASLALRPTKPDWAVGMRAVWEPSEQGAEKLLARFLDGPIWRYRYERDFPARCGVSRLSPTSRTARFRRGGSIGRRGPGRKRKAAASKPFGPSSASLSGASSLGPTSTISRSCPMSHCAPSSRTFPGRSTRKPCAPGRKGVRVIQSSMPACANCGRRAGCTIACA